MLGTGRFSIATASFLIVIGGAVSDTRYGA